MILTVEGEVGELRGMKEEGMEEEGMIRTGWKGDERPTRENERVIREGQRVMEYGWMGRSYIS